MRATLSLVTKFSAWIVGWIATQSHEHLGVLNPLTEPRSSTPPPP